MTGTIQAVEAAAGLASNGWKPYPAYKPSGVPWLGQVPEHWEMVRGKSLFERKQRHVRTEDDIVTCFRDGIVTLRKNRRTTGFTNALKEIGYQGVRRGDLVIHVMDAFAGAVGVSDSDGKCTPVYSVCEPQPEANAHYFAYLIREMSRTGFILALAKGIRERSSDFRYETFGALRFCRPPPDEQDAIVRFLDYYDRLIRKYIRAKQKLIALLEEKRIAATKSILSSSRTKQLRFGAVADRVNRPVQRVVDQEYTPIGLYNRGRGLFHKQATKGEYLGDSLFFYIKAGDLVFSGQFAWEGAVALARDEDDGCIASHRYPVFQSRPNVSMAGYLLSFFRTDFGHMLLNYHSRGAAGRNRPLNDGTLMKEKIPIPSLEKQSVIEEMLNREMSLRKSVADSITRISEYRTHLTADVVTGEIDVREAAAVLPAGMEDTPVDETDLNEAADEEEVLNVET